MGKNWCFTLNNYTAKQYDSLLNYDCRYIIIGKEQGQTGTPHLQGYVVFHKNVRLSYCKKVNPAAHWECAKGTSEQNRTYCSKDNVYEERGTIPLSRKDIGALQKEKWAHVIACARDGTVENEYPREFVQYNTTLSRLYCPVLKDLDCYSGFWYVGPPGTGKSKTARMEFPGAYDKLLNKWWDGYTNESSVIIDDLGIDHIHMGSFLKRYADHYPFRAEHKGGSRLIRPTNIIVTSNYEIEEIWPTDAPLVAALKRRYKIVRFSVLNKST